MYYILQIFFGVFTFSSFFSHSKQIVASGCLLEKFGTWSSRPLKSGLYCKVQENHNRIFSSQPHSNI